MNLSFSIFLLLSLILVLVSTFTDAYFSRNSHPPNDEDNNNNNDNNQDGSTSLFFSQKKGNNNENTGGYFSRHREDDNSNDQNDEENASNEKDSLFFRNSRGRSNSDTNSNNNKQSNHDGHVTDDEQNDLIIDVSSSKKFMNNNNNNKKQNGKDADNNNNNLGVGTVTSSVLGPHTSRDEATKQRKNARENSVPAKLLREWELKSSHHPCWKRAVLRLKTVCNDILADKTKRSRLAIEFMYCQLELDGKQLAASSKCDFDDEGNTVEIASCASRLPETLYPVKVHFDNHVDVLCFHIQEEQLHERTQQVVDRLGTATEQAARNFAELSLRTTHIDQGMQSLHGSQKLATASAETLAISLNQITDMQSSMKKSFEDERVGIETIVEKVQRLADTHESVERSTAELAEGLKLLTEKHSLAVNRLGTEVDETRQKVMAGIQGLTSVQEKTSRFIGSVDAFIHYSLVFFVLWIITTSQRTQDARFAALLTGLVASMFAEKMLLRGFLKFFAYFGFCPQPSQVIINNDDGDHQNTFSSASPSPSAFFEAKEKIGFYPFSNLVGSSADLHLDPTPIRNFFLVLAFAMVVLSAYFYESPEDRQRKVLQIELTRAMNRALGKSISPDPENRNNNNNNNNNNNGFFSRIIARFTRKNINQNYEPTPNANAKKNFNPRLVSSMERTNDEDINVKENINTSIQREESTSAKSRRSSSTKKK